MRNATTRWYGSRLQVVGVPALLVLIAALVLQGCCGSKRCACPTASAAPTASPTASTTASPTPGGALPGVQPAGTRAHPAGRLESIADSAVESDSTAGQGPLYFIDTRLFRVGPKGETISAPKLAVRPGQRAHLSITNQSSYVQDFDASVQGEQVVADPIVGVIQEGLSIEILCVPAPDAERQVDVAWRVSQSSLLRPIATRDVQLHARGIPATIQTPTVFLEEQWTAERLPLNTTRVVGHFADAKGGGAFRMELNVRAIGAIGDVPVGRAAIAPGDSTGQPTADDAAGIPVTPLGDLVSADAPAGRLRIEPLEVPASLQKQLQLKTGTEVTQAETQAALSSKEVQRTPLVLAGRLAPGAGAQRIWQRTYLKDFKAVGTPHEQAIAVDPEVDTIRSGLIARITGTAEAPVLHIVHARLEQMPRFRQAVGNGPVVERDAPALEVTHHHLPLSEQPRYHVLYVRPDGGAFCVRVSVEKR